MGTSNNNSVVNCRVIVFMSFGVHAQAKPPWHHSGLCASEDVRTACQCNAAQMAMFTVLQSEYLLQSTGLADPTVTANGAVGKTNSCNETVSVNETAENRFSPKH